MSDRQRTAQSPETEQPAAAASAGVWFAAGLLRLLGDFARRRRDRRLLAGLDERELRDVGLDRGGLDCDSTERLGTTWSWPPR